MTLKKSWATPLLALTLFSDVGNANQAIWLTSIQPFTGADWDAGISMRLGGQILLEEVNANPSLLPGYELKIAWQDGLCSKGVGTQLFLENLFDRKYTVFAPGKNLSQLDVDGDGTVTTADTAPMGEIWDSTRVTPNPVGLLGSGCAGTALNIANIAYMARFPMVSNSATRPGLSDRGSYPNFFRTIMPDTFFNDAWIRMAKELNQTGVGVVIGEVENWGSMGSTLANAALSQGVQMIGNDLTADMANFYGMKVALDSAAMAASAARDLLVYKPRVIILLMFHKRNRLVLCEAFKVSYFNAVYMPMGWLPFGWWSIADTTCSPTDLTDMAVGFISANMMFWRADSNTRLSCSASMTAKEFQDEWFRRQGGTHGDLSMRPEGYAPATEAATTADAVCMYAQMLHEVLINRAVPLSDVTERTVNGYNNVFDVLSNTNFEGVQGTVKFNPGEADPLGSVILQQLQYDSTGSLTLLDVASYKHPVITFLGLGTLKFQFPGESFFAGPNGATALNAGITNYGVCVNQVLDMRTNLCKDCPNNTQYVQRSGACLCVAGFYGAASGCTPCPAGTISTAPGTLTCATCEVGKYSRAGSTSCTFCPRGRFSNAIGLGECHACPSLLTTENIASESISDCICDTGAYKDIYSSTGCTPCPATSFTSGLAQENITSCMCPKDTYMENSVCESCPANSVTMGKGKTRILDCQCQRDMYLKDGICKTCPDGSTTLTTGKTAVESCLCGDGTYMPKDSRACLECPKGMVCPLGSSEKNSKYILTANKTSEQIFMSLAQGFWASQSAPMEVFECRSKEKCIGGLPGTNCAPNLRNEQACEHCQAGYHWNGDTCELCSDFETSPFLYPILPLLFAPVILCIMYKLFGDTFEKWSSWRNGVFSLLFILINFYQTVDITSTINIKLPSVSMTMFTMWAWTNNVGAIFKLDCAGFAEYDASIIMRGVVPFILAGYCLLIFGICTLLSKVCRMAQLTMDVSRMINVFGSLMFTFYNTIASFSLLLFKCSNNPSGHQSLSVDLSIGCGASSEAWNSMVGAAVIWLITYIVGMGGLFTYTIIVAPKHFGELTFQTRWKFLFIKFRADAYWWGLVFLTKNFLVNLSFVMSAEGIVQLYLTMAVSTLYMCIVVLVTPFRHRVANALDIVGSLCILYISALLTWYADRQDAEGMFSSVDVTTGVISILPAIVAVGCLCHLARYGYNAPPTQREVIQAEREFQEVVNVFKDLCQLSAEEGAMVILEIGEWDRRYLRQAITALKTEALGHHSSLRVANKALSERVMTRVNSVKVTRSASEFGGKDVPQQPGDEAAAQVFVTV